MAAVGDSERSAGAVLVGGVGQRGPCPKTNIHQVKMVVAIKAAHRSGELRRGGKLEGGLRIGCKVRIRRRGRVKLKSRVAADDSGAAAGDCTRNCDVSAIGFDRAVVFDTAVNE